MELLNHCMSKDKKINKIFFVVYTDDLGHLKQARYIFNKITFSHSVQHKQNMYISI